MSHSPLFDPYWQNRGHFTVIDNILLFDEYIVLPSAMRLNLIDKIHGGHLGITKCCARAHISVWWPGLSTQVKEMVKSCKKCIIECPVKKDPLLPSSSPNCPWERVGMDLFEINGKMHIQ